MLYEESSTPISHVVHLLVEPRFTKPSELNYSLITASHREEVIKKTINFHVNIYLLTFASICLFRTFNISFIIAVLYFCYFNVIIFFNAVIIIIVIDNNPRIIPSLSNLCCPRSLKSSNS